MRVSLRLRVLALVFLINAVVFGLGGALALRTQIDARARLEADLTEDLLSTIRRTLRADGLNVLSILQWPMWGFFEDAMVVDGTIERGAGGGIRTPGIVLNPLGRGGRPPRFDQSHALAAMEESIRTHSPVDDVEGGRVVPIEPPEGEERGPWGAVWFRAPDRRADERELFRTVAQWFVLSTLVLTLGTFLAMRRLLLDPVASLAEGVRRVRSGDFSVRLSEPDRRDELADLVRSFNEMTATVQGFNDRLAEEVRRATAQARQAEAAAMTQRRLAAMGELAAGIAHEINNPLGGLLNAVRALEREDLPAEKRTRYVGLLASGLTRIGETVARLRRFTPRPPSREEVDLADVVRDAVDLVRHRAERLGVSVATEGLEGAAPRVSGARNELGQALLNLLANSLDALEERGHGGRVTVRLARAEGGGALLVVRDDGPGVAPEDLSRVQDLFYTTKEVGKGTGLGLALVHNAVQQHGGEVRITSEAGRFFEVELRLPPRGRAGEEARR